MIKNITSSGKYIQISGSAGSTYVNNNSGAQGVGNMRFNTINQNIEIYDGFAWIVMSTGFTSIGLTGEAESLLDWAKKKRDEELERDRLAQSNPAIQDLMKQINDKEEQIKMIMTLIKSPGYNTDETKVNP